MVVISSKYGKSEERRCDIFVSKSIRIRHSESNELYRRRVQAPASEVMKFPFMEINSLISSRIQHEWALPLWRAILHSQHELPESINDAVILSVGALVLVDLNDHKLKVEKICTTLREVFVGFEIFLKRLVTNIHLLEGFVSDTTLPSLMFYLLSTPHKEIHTHSLELYKK